MALAFYQSHPGVVSTSCLESFWKSSVEVNSSWIRSLFRDFIDSDVVVGVKGMPGWGTRSQRVAVATSI